MNKREWLVTQGLAKPGRGKLSKLAHEALDKARSEGTVFDDDNEVVVKVSSNRSGPLNVPVVNSDESESVSTVKVFPKTSQMAANPVEPIGSRVRKENTAFVVEKASRPGSADLIVGFSNCGRCSKTVSYCNCNEITPPKYLKGQVSLKRPSN